MKKPVSFLKFLPEGSKREKSVKKALIHIGVFFLTFGVIPETFAQNHVYGSVVISEVMARPNPELSSMPDSEYVELHNRSDQPISLKGWTYSDISRTVTLPDVSIPAGAYALLVPASRLGRWRLSTVRCKTIPD